MKKALLLPFIVSPLLAVLLFGSAGRIDLPWAWGAWGILFVNHFIGLLQEPVFTNSPYNHDRGRYRGA